MGGDNIKKILLVATVDEHILAFHLPLIETLKSNKYSVDVASNGNLLNTGKYIDTKYNVAFSRSPYKLTNIKAFLQLKNILGKKSYDIVHCNTPVASALVRIAARILNNEKTKVIYTAHGFHFYKGAALINWLIYYPIEKWLSKYTDCLITINKEDYNLAMKKKFKARDIRLINGIGVDFKRFTPVNIEQKKKIRKEYGYGENDFILFYAAELNKNKNQKLLIDVVNELRSKIPNIKLLLAGEGPMKNQYLDYINKLKLNDSIEILGYRKDIDKLLAISDLVTASSKREGLPVNVIEAMAAGVPIVATDIRGHRDLIISEVTGYIISGNNIRGFTNAILKLYGDFNLMCKFSNNGVQKVKKYSIEYVLYDMGRVLDDILRNEK